MGAPQCWFKGRPGSGPCAGRLERAHWIKQQTIRRAIGPLDVPCPRCAAPAGERCPGLRQPAHGERRLALQEVLWDPRVWTPMCANHHRRLDHERSIRVARVELSPGVEEYASERGLEWWLDREYGEREEQAA